MRSASSPRAVSMMIGTCECRRSSRQTSYPDPSGKHHVQEDEVGVDPPRELERLGHGARDLGVEALPTERLRERLGDRGLILDEENGAFPLHVGIVPTPAMSEAAHSRRRCQGGPEKGPCGAQPQPRMSSRCGRRRHRGQTALRTTKRPVRAARSLVDWATRSPWEEEKVLSSSSSPPPRPGFPPWSSPRSSSSPRRDRSLRRGRHRRLRRGRRHRGGRRRRLARDWGLRGRRRHRAPVHRGSFACSASSHGPLMSPGLARSWWSLVVRSGRVGRRHRSWSRARAC